jgi:hypothetical protein
MEDVPKGQERSPAEIRNHLDELRASYTWSSNGQDTKQDEYQCDVLNLLHLALYDMNLFFQRLNIVRKYYRRQATKTKQLTMWDVAESDL